MATILFISQFVIAIILTVVVLLQKSSSIGLGAYSGSNESVFGAKGPAGFMTKLTFALGIIFIINTISLGYIYNKQTKSSIVETIDMDTNIPSVPSSAIISESDESAPSAPTTNQAPAAPNNTQ